MNENHQKEIIAKLKAFDEAGIRFVDAKQKLIEEGYSDQEVTVASYNVPYDGKPNLPEQRTALQQYIHDHPEAVDIAKFDRPSGEKQDRTPSVKAAFFKKLAYLTIFGTRTYFMHPYRNRSLKWLFFLAVFIAGVKFLHYFLLEKFGR